MPAKKKYKDGVEEFEATLSGEELRKFQEHKRIISDICSSLGYIKARSGREIIRRVRAKM